jgi:hypothetical protein
MNPLTLTPGQPAELALTLRRNASAWPIPDGAIVAGSLVSASDPTIVLIPTPIIMSDYPGQQWATGGVTITYSAAHTAALTPGPVLLLVMVQPPILGAPLEMFYFPVEVAIPADLSPLFVRGPALASLRQDRLLNVIQTYAPGATFSDDYLWAKLRAAEADAERQLRVFFSPVEIIPQGSPEDTAALDAANVRWIEEPGYDFDPDLFQGETWGLIETRQRPIIRIDSIYFAWPAPGMGVAFTVPDSWLRIDKKYGRLNLVPTQNLLTLPLNTFILSALSGGRSVPLMMQIRYAAGLKNAARDYPDLADLVQKMAVLNLLADLFLPQSGSISADGLSQSMSLDLDKYQQSVKDRLETLRQAIHGVRHMVF